LWELEELVNDLDVSYHHPPATISSKAQLVKNLGGLVASPDALAESLPLVADQFAAGEASDRDYHSGPPYL